VTVDNVVRRLRAAGKTWSRTRKNIPSVGYTGGDVGGYARKDNTIRAAFRRGERLDPAADLVPFTQFATDLANGTLPDYSNIVPNLCNDAHDARSPRRTRGSRPTSRRYWPAHVPARRLLIITFDEAEATTQTAAAASRGWS